MPSKDCSVAFKGGSVKGICPNHKLHTAFVKICLEFLNDVPLGVTSYPVSLTIFLFTSIYEGWNFNSGNYLFTTDTK